MLATLMAIPPHIRRGMFYAYLTLLLIALLWPNARIQGPIPRSDLAVHLTVFSLFSFLAWLSTLFGPHNSWATIARILIFGLLFGLATELLQLIPILHRTFGLDDWLFNTLGTALGLIPPAIATAVRKR